MDATLWDNSEGESSQMVLETEKELTNWPLGDVAIISKL